MAAKINWHRYGAKLRHCHPMYRAVLGNTTTQRYADRDNDSGNNFVVGLSLIMIHVGRDMTSRLVRPSSVASTSLSDICPPQISDPGHMPPKPPSGPWLGLECRVSGYSMDTIRVRGSRLLFGVMVRLLRRDRVRVGLR